MTHTENATPIVVGIDGSDAAIGAARWALAESTSRGVRLRLVHVLETGPDPSSAQALVSQRQQGDAYLRRAHAALSRSAPQARVSTRIACGDVDTTLIDESRRAQLIAVGSVGIGYLASHILGSTALALANQAQCPVAIVRRDGDPGPRSSIVVVVNDQPDNDEVVSRGFEEARLRQARLLAIGVWRWDSGLTPADILERRLARWTPLYPDVEVHSCAAECNAAEYLATTQLPIRLLVTGAADAKHLTRIIGPHSHPILSHPYCSVLIVRH